jgi:hypothetical protein
MSFTACQNRNQVVKQFAEAGSGAFPVSCPTGTSSFSLGVSQCVKLTTPLHPVLGSYASTPPYAFMAYSITN